MNILIVGGTSSVGKVLKKSLTLTHNVKTAGRKYCDIQIDLEDSIDNIVLPTNLDAVIILAAHFGGKTDEDIYAAENINVLGTLKVCQAALNANAKHVILISSIFALLKNGASNYSAYSLSKKHSEEIAELFCNSFKLPLTILQPSQIYGNLDNFKIRQPFLNMILDKAEEGLEINIFGEHDAKINIIHVEDLVNIIKLITEKKVTGKYSCTNPMDISYTQFAKLAYEINNHKGKISFLSEHNNIEDNIFEYNSNLFDKIKYYPQVTFQEGIKRMYNIRKTLI